MKKKDDQNVKEQLKRKRKLSESSDDPSDESFDSDDSEGDNEYQNDDFVVPDDEASESDESEGRSGDSEAESDDQDYQPGKSHKLKSEGKQPSGKRLKRIAEESKIDKKELNQSASKEEFEEERESGPRRRKLRPLKPQDEQEGQSGEDQQEQEDQEDHEDQGEGYGEDEEAEGDDFNLYDMRPPTALDKIFNEQDIEKAEEERRREIEREIIKKRTITDLFEPADLIKNFETPADKLIIETDIPERLQLLYKHRDEPTDEELQAEARWVLIQLTLHRSLTEKEQELLTQRIYMILRFIRVFFCEMMYVWTYRQQEFTLDPKQFPGHYKLKLSDLWFIQEADQEWRDFWARTQVVNKLLGMMQNYQHVADNILEFKEKAFNIKHLDWMIEWIDHQNRKLYTFQELKRSFELMELKGLTSNLTGDKTIAYEMHKRGLTRAAESFSLTADQLAENLLANQRVHRPPIMAQKPMELCRANLKPDFPQFSSESPLFNEMLNYLAQEYYLHPIIRKILFQEMRDIVTLNSEPTDKGKSLTVYDYYYPAKRVSFKRIDKSVNQIWLLLLEAEKKGLVRIVFNYEGGGQNNPKYTVRQKLASHLKLQNDAISDSDKTSADWNKVRDTVIYRLIENQLTPEFEKALRQELTENAEKHVANHCLASLRNLINTKPYRMKDQSGFAMEPDSVLACANDENNVLFVILRKTGEVQDYMELRNLMRRPMENNITLRNLYNQDIQSLQNFMMKNKPGVIVVAPKSLKSQNLKLELRNIAENVAKDLSTKEPFVMWGNLTISSAFARSSLSENILPGSSLLFKEAVSTGRFIQNPLAETLNLWSENENANGLLQLNLHQFQHMANPYKLKSKMENLLVELVNQVGVDIHSCVRYSHLAAQLQFVNGLGPRKATKLLERIRYMEEQTARANEGRGQGFMRHLGAGRISVEEESGQSAIARTRRFFAENELIKQTVLLNCIGFLKVFGNANPQTFSDTAEDFDWLDFTRIHPDDYSVAQTIAKSVIDNPTASANVNVLRLFKQPDQLDKYRLDEYAESLSAQHKANMVPKIDFIVKEFKEPFSDERNDFPTRQDNQDVFYKLSGESKYLFLEGAIITGRIIVVKDLELKVLTGSELIGVAKLSDNRDDPEAEASNNYIVGNYLRAKVKRINYDKFIIDLSINPKDLSSHQDFLNYNKILGWYELSDGHGFKIIRDEDYPRNILEAKRTGKNFQIRKVSHPYFKNIGLEKAKEFLADRTRGEFIFRPSSKGSNYINVTWKMLPDFYVHLLIQEGAKSANEEISRHLLLDKREFDSLDNIVANYIRPCNKIIDNILNNEKFTIEGVEKVRTMLLETKAANPNMIPYRFTVAKEYPQYIILCYAGSKDSVKFELAKIKPNGIDFHQQKFSNLDYLIKFFKENLKSKDYKKYVESLPKVEFGIIERKEEAKEELMYAKEEMRRRGFRNDGIKREYQADQRAKYEYIDSHGPRAKQEYGSGFRRPSPSNYREPRRKGSDDSLEYDRRSPPRAQAKREADTGVKMESGFGNDGAYTRSSQPKKPNLNFEAA